MMSDDTGSFLPMSSDPYKKLKHHRSSFLHDEELNEMLSSFLYDQINYPCLLALGEFSFPRFSYFAWRPADNKCGYKVDPIIISSPTGYEIDCEIML